MKTTFIRSIKLSDKEDWQELYQGYAEFYKVEMTQTILNTVWRWLNDEQHELNGLVCEFEEKIPKKCTCPPSSKALPRPRLRPGPSPVTGRF